MVEALEERHVGMRHVVLIGEKSRRWQLQLGDKITLELQACPECQCKLVILNVLNELAVSLDSSQLVQARSHDDLQLVARLVDKGKTLHRSRKLALVQSSKDVGVDILHVIVGSCVVAKDVGRICKVLEARDDLIILLQAVSRAKTCYTVDG